MAKLLTMFIVLIVIQFCLIIYANQQAESTQLWEFVTGFNNWDKTSLYVAIGTLAGTLLLAGIASGGSFRFVTDFIVAAPAIAMLMSFGVVFINLEALLRKEIIARFFVGCSPNCPPAILLTGIMLGWLALYYLWSVLEWWRGKDV
jgi:hypothetical protein